MAEIHRYLLGFGYRAEVTPSLDAGNRRSMTRIVAVADMGLVAHSLVVDMG